jgi:hypothetical protein
MGKERQVQLLCEKSVVPCLPVLYAWHVKEKKSGATDLNRSTAMKVMNPMNAGKWITVNWIS